jgi:hypothetical protein
MKNEIPKGKYCRDYRPYVKIINGLWLELILRAKNFTNNTCGVEISKLQRKAGKEYCDVIDNLAQANKLENLKGNFVRLVCQEDKFAHLEYVESQTLVKKILNLLNSLSVVDLKI